MKSIGFVGQMDNSGIVLCIARLVAQFGKKVIVIDATSQQRTRYTVPGITSRTVEQYVNKHDSVDVAVGFNNILELKKWHVTKGEDFNDYDYVFINTDRVEMCEEFDISNANSLFFTTTYDLYDLDKGVELLKYVCASKRNDDTNAKIRVNTIIASTAINTVDSRRIDDLTRDMQIEQIGEKIELSYDEGDLSALIQNQYSNKIEFKNLSRQTKEGIAEAACRIMEEPKDRVLKAVKGVERNASFSRRR
jgi:hypothetical protein